MTNIYYYLQSNVNNFRKSHPNDAGYDLEASIADKPITINPGQRELIGTGLFLKLSPDIHAEIRPRSGLALKHGITVLNSPGTIDYGYTGEIRVILINLGNKPFIINNGDRIAQIIFTYNICEPVIKVVNLDEITEYDNIRGTKGFGSTGK